MHTTSQNLNQLILDQLAAGEKRLLVLTVAIRKSLGVTAIKGDLSARVQSALRGLVASKSIVNDDGAYSLPPLPSLPRQPVRR
ncbi:MAG TPA: hypothetical protein VHY37_04235 [Tepidisphaeraceae bacterium]|nr:hypothetical protein [Tepidisphaeraceae bacterium]